MRGFRAFLAGWVERDREGVATTGRLSHVDEFANDLARLKRLLGRQHALVERLKAETAAQLAAQRLCLKAER